MESDEDEAALRAIRACNHQEELHDASSDGPTRTGTRAENLAELRRRRWPDAALRGRQKEKKYEVQQKAVEKDIALLIPEELPQTCRYSRGEASTGVKLSAGGICRGAFGLHENSSLSRKDVIAAESCVSTRSVKRSQTFLGDAICCHTDRHIQSKLDACGNEDCVNIKFTWDEASMYMAVSRHTLRNMLGDIAEDFIERPKLLPNGKQRAQPSFVAQILQSQAFPFFSFIVFHRAPKAPPLFYRAPKGGLRNIMAGPNPNPRVKCGPINRATERATERPSNRLIH